MFAKLTAIGRLTRDPEPSTYTTDTGEEVSLANFTLACNLDKNTTEFIQFTAWRHQAEVLVQYAKKGQLLYVEATPRTSSYEIEKDGVSFSAKSTRYTVTAFKFLSSSRADEQDEEEAPF